MLFYSWTTLYSYQDKAYDLVKHEILINKLEILGFKSPALLLMKSFLGERKQYVQIEGIKSEKLVTGPYSVIQGSTMSCALYLAYILDMPNLFHQEPHKPENQRKCEKPNMKTFIDDGYILIKKQRNKDLKTSIEETMTEVNKYTLANRLHLNQDKTQIMLQTKDKNLKETFCVNLGGKEIYHSKEVNILGNTLSDELTWDRHVTKNVIPSLRNRVRTLRGVNKFLDRGFRACYSNSVFQSKLMYGIENWGGGAKNPYNENPKSPEYGVKIGST